MDAKSFLTDIAYGLMSGFLEAPDNNSIPVKEDLLRWLLNPTHIFFLLFLMLPKRLLRLVFAFYIRKGYSFTLVHVKMYSTFCFASLVLSCQAYSCCLKGDSHIQANIFLLVLTWYVAMNLAFPMPVILSTRPLHRVEMIKVSVLLRNVNAMNYREAIVFNQMQHVCSLHILKVLVYSHSLLISELGSFNS